MLRQNYSNREEEKNHNYNKKKTLDIAMMILCADLQICKHRFVIDNLKVKDHNYLH